MSIEVPVIRDGYTVITQSEPPVWRFYNVGDSTYSAARPVACWSTREGERTTDRDYLRTDWIEAHTNVSKTTGKQYRLVARWDEGQGEWVVTERTVIE